MREFKIEIKSVSCIFTHGSRKNEQFESAYGTKTWNQQQKSRQKEIKTVFLQIINMKVYYFSKSNFSHKYTFRFRRITSCFSIGCFSDHNPLFLFRWDENESVLKIESIDFNIELSNVSEQYLALGFINGCNTLHT